MKKLYSILIAAFAFAGVASAQDGDKPYPYFGRVKQSHLSIPSSGIDKDFRLEWSDGKKDVAMLVGMENHRVFVLYNERGEEVLSMNLTTGILKLKDDSEAAKALVHAVCITVRETYFGDPNYDAPLQCAAQ